MLKQVLVLERICFKDDRGMFCKLPMLEKPILQVNHSVTKLKGTVRGLHYQNLPFAESKIITCLHGSVFDVAVNLKDLSWSSVVLSEDNQKVVVIPEGYAHGFQALEDDSELLYLHTNLYNKEVEGGLHVLNEKIGIKWPLPVINLSERDRGFK